MEEADGDAAATASCCFLHSKNSALCCTKSVRSSAIATGRCRRRAERGDRACCCGGPGATSTFTLICASWTAAGPALWGVLSGYAAWPARVGESAGDGESYAGGIGAPSGSFGLRVTGRGAGRRTPLLMIEERPATGLPACVLVLRPLVPVDVRVELIPTAVVPPLTPSRPPLEIFPPAPPIDWR